MSGFLTFEPSSRPTLDRLRTCDKKLSALSRRATPGLPRAIESGPWRSWDTRGTLLGTHLRPTAAAGRCRDMDWARAEIPGVGKGLTDLLLFTCPQFEGVWPNAICVPQPPTPCPINERVFCTAVRNVDFLLIMFAESGSF